MAVEDIEAYAKRQGEDYVEILLENGRLVTGKNLRKVGIGTNIGHNTWQFEEEGMFTIQLNGYSIIRIAFVN